MKDLKLIVFFSFLLYGCSAGQTQIRRLSPVQEASVPPSECRIITVLPDSPAFKSGLKVGDKITKVNQKLPPNAVALADLVAGSPADMKTEIITSTGKTEEIAIKLNDQKPRLGALCDLTGYRKSGITSAGNESVTMFDGPYAVTTSGIIDKGVAFMRVRITNNGEKVLAVSPRLFQAADGSGKPVQLFTPKQVMCFLYGEKGAQLLTTKKKQKETLDSDIATQMTSIIDEPCPSGTSARFSGADMQYAEANADYVATESLWPVNLASGTTADGLIYFREPGSLPISVSATVEGRRFAAQFAMPVAKGELMPEEDVAAFFESQKKGTPLRVTLKKGKVFVGRFASYDSLDEKAWFDSPSGGMLNSVSFPVKSIRTVEPIEPVPPKTESVKEFVN